MTFRPADVSRDPHGIGEKTGPSKSRNEEMKWEMRKWGMRKWGNGKKVHCISLSKLLTFCYCSHQGKVNVHACTHWEIIFAWQLTPKEYALHHGLQANSMYKFLTFGSLLAISSNLLNLWSVHTLFQLYTTLWGFFMQSLSLLWIKT